MSSTGQPTWRGVVLFGGPPTAWMAHLLVSYLLVAPVCGASTLPLHLTTVAAVVGALGSIALGWRVVGRDRPQVVTAALFGGLFVLAIVLQGAANAVVDPCA